MIITKHNLHIKKEKKVREISKKAILKSNTILKAKCFRIELKKSKNVFKRFSFWVLRLLAL